MTGPDRLAVPEDEARKVWQEGARSDPRNESLVETMTRLKVKP